MNKESIDLDEVFAENSEDGEQQNPPTKKGYNSTHKVLTTSHQYFIECIIKGYTKRDAYIAMLVNKGKKEPNKLTASSKGSILYKRLLPNIEARRKEVRSITTEYLHAELISAELATILSVMQVDARLCEVINNAPNESDRLRAIDIYYKRFGCNEPVKQDIRVQKVGLDASTDEYA